MFGKKKEVLSPITDKHRQLAEQAQQRWSAIGQMSDPVENFFGF